MPKLKLNPSTLADFRSDGYPSTMQIAEALYPEVAEGLVEKIEAILGADIELDLTEDEAMCLAASMDRIRHKLPADQEAVITEWYERWLLTLPPVHCMRQGCTNEAVWCFYSTDVNHQVNDYRCEDHAGEYKRFAHRIRPESKETS